MSINHFPTILLTRSICENLATRNMLVSNRFHYVLLPLIKYENLTINYSDIFQNYKNLIITSKHAAKLVSEAITLLNSSKNLKTWVVGNKSAEILSSTNRFEVEYIGESVADFIQNISAPHSDYIYLSADIITKDLPKTISRKIIYKTIYKTVIDSVELEHMNSKIDYILLYSENCAKLLLELLNRYNLLSILKTATIIAISNKVATIMKPYCDTIYSATHPSQDEILNMLLCHANREKK